MRSQKNGSGFLISPSRYKATFKFLYQKRSRVVMISYNCIFNFDIKLLIINVGY